MLPDFELCCAEFSKYSFNLSREKFEQLDYYANFLVEYNKNVNLTAITDPQEILTKHFIDSILLCKYVDIPENASIIDVGTGAGFPSVPLKIYRPDVQITLLDSLNKRIIFLDLLCEKLGISAKTIHGRAEDISKKIEYREKFDIACARAVANMSLLGELCIPFIKVGGSFVSMKGPSEDVSIGFNAVKILGCGDLTETAYMLGEDSRRIFTAKKISQTPTKFPRSSSQIKKKLL